MSSLWFEPKWPAPSGVRVVSTLRGEAGGGGASKPPYACFNLGCNVGDDPRAVAENRRILRREAGLPVEPAWLAQVHGVSVADLDKTGSDVAADAAITRRPGCVCAILTADCLPVVFATDTGDMVAAAHAGWRGLAAGVIGATLRAMAAKPERLIAWLGLLRLGRVLVHVLYLGGFGDQAAGERGQRKGVHPFNGRVQVLSDLSG